jgi:hypothetical protein
MNPMTLAELHTLAQRMGVPVRPSLWEQTGWYHDTNIILMEPRDAHEPFVLAHELAHATSHLRPALGARYNAAIRRFRTQRAAVRIEEHLADAVAHALTGRRREDCEDAPPYPPLTGVRALAYVHAKTQEALTYMLAKMETPA